jgi:hypothetical protein
MPVTAFPGQSVLAFTSDFLRRRQPRPPRPRHPGFTALSRPSHRTAESCALLRWTAWARCNGRSGYADQPPEEEGPGNPARPTWLAQDRDRPVVSPDRPRQGPTDQEIPGRPGGKPAGIPHRAPGCREHGAQRQGRTRQMILMTVPPVRDMPVAWASTNIGGAREGRSGGSGPRAGMDLGADHLYAELTRGTALASHHRSSGRETAEERGAVHAEITASHPASHLPVQIRKRPVRVA